MNLAEKCGCLSLLLLAHLCSFSSYCSATPNEDTTTVLDVTTDGTTPPIPTTPSTNHSQTINSRIGRTEKKIKGGSSYEDHYYSGPIYGQVNSYGYGNNHDHYGGSYNNAGKGKGKGKGKGDGKGKGSSRPYYPPLPPAPYIPSAPAYGSGYKGEDGYKGESYAPGYKDESKEYSPPAYGEVHGTSYSSDYGKPTGDAYKGHGYSGDSYGKGPGYVQPIYYYVYYPYERPKKGWFKKVSDKVSDAKAKHLEEKGKKLQEKGYQLITKGKELESYGQTLNDYSASYETASDFYVAPGYSQITPPTYEEQIPNPVDPYLDQPTINPSSSSPLAIPAGAATEPIGPAESYLPPRIPGEVYPGQLSADIISHIASFAPVRIKGPAIVAAAQDQQVHPQPIVILSNDEYVVPNPKLVKVPKEHRNQQYSTDPNSQQGGPQSAIQENHPVELVGNALEGYHLEENEGLDPPAYIQNFPRSISSGQTSGLTEENAILEELKVPTPSVAIADLANYQQVLSPTVNHTSNNISDINVDQKEYALIHSTSINSVSHNSELLINPQADPTRIGENQLWNDEGRVDDKTIYSAERKSFEGNSNQVFPKHPPPHHPHGSKSVLQHPSHPQKVNRPPHHKEHAIKNQHSFKPSLLLSVTHEKPHQHHQSRPAEINKPATTIAGVTGGKKYPTSLQIQPAGAAKPATPSPPRAITTPPYNPPQYPKQSTKSSQSGVTNRPKYEEKKQVNNTSVNSQQFNPFSNDFFNSWGDNATFQSQNDFFNSAPSFEKFFDGKYPSPFAWPDNFSGSRTARKHDGKRKRRRLNKEKLTKKLTPKTIYEVDLGWLPLAERDTSASESVSLPLNTLPADHEFTNKNISDLDKGVHNRVSPSDGMWEGATNKKEKLQLEKLKYRKWRDERKSKVSLLFPAKNLETSRQVLAERKANQDVADKLNEDKESSANKLSANSSQKNDEEIYLEMDRIEEGSGSFFQNDLALQEAAREKINDIPQMLVPDTLHTVRDENEASMISQADSITSQVDNNLNENRQLTNPMALPLNQKASNDQKEKFINNTKRSTHQTEDKQKEKSINNTRRSTNQIEEKLKTTSETEQEVHSKTNKNSKKATVDEEIQAEKTGVINQELNDKNKGFFSENFLPGFNIGIWGHPQGLISQAVSRELDGLSWEDFFPVFPETRLSTEEKMPKSIHINYGSQSDSSNESEASTKSKLNFKQEDEQQNRRMLNEDFLNNINNENESASYTKGVELDAGIEDFKREMRTLFDSFEAREHGDNFIPSSTVLHKIRPREFHEREET